MRENYFVSWKPQFSVHIDEIDRQHKVLVNLIRELQEAMWEGRGRAFQSTLIDRLAAYVEVHLSYEETMMRENDYEFLDEHAEQHRQSADQVRELQQKIHDAEPISNAYLMLFLRNWLYVHIMQHDQKFARTLLAADQPQESAAPAQPQGPAAPARPPRLPASPPPNRSTVTRRLIPY